MSTFTLISRLPASIPFPFENPVLFFPHLPSFRLPADIDIRESRISNSPRSNVQRILVLICGLEVQARHIRFLRI